MIKFKKIIDNNIYIIYTGLIISGEEVCLRTGRKQVYNPKKSNNVVLVKLPNYTNTITVPLGIGYLFKAIKSIPAVTPVFIDAQLDLLDEKKLLTRIQNSNPFIIGFQVYSVDYLFFQKIIRQVRKLCPQAIIIAGGAHVSALPREILIENPDLDFIVQGEGEPAMVPLIKVALADFPDDCLSQIPNLVFRTKDGIKMNYRQMADLNALGAPDWEILHPHTYPASQHGILHQRKRVVPIITSRGCPCPCTFCAGPLISGKKIRLRTPEDIVAEIEYLQQNYKFEEFIIEDENFTFYKKHVLQVAAEIQRKKLKIWISIPGGIRPDRLDQEIVNALKQSGTYMIGFGIESGSVRTLQRIGKNWDLAMVREKIDLLKANGIIVNGNFIIGFPEETMTDIRQTIDYAVQSNLDTIILGNYNPFPGTLDFKQLLQKGEISMITLDWNCYTYYLGRLPYHPQAVSEKMLIKAIRYGTIRFYCRPRILLNLLKRITKAVYLQGILFRIIRVFNIII